MPGEPVAGADRGLPAISQWRLRLFTTYLQWYLSRNFHGVHLLRIGSLEAVEDRAVLACVNHPSWWDPLLSFYLSRRFFASRANYGPIAAAGVEKYKFFESIGFFGIDPHSRTGAEKFLRVGQRCLSRADHALWVTPQGAFVDVRRRPMVIAKGVGHLARRMCADAQPVAMLPIAFEYAFWNERFPEAFACIGEPVFVEGDKTPAAWSECFAAALERTQDALSQRVQMRDPACFESLIKGRAGIGGIYDLWRAAKAKALGRKFEPEHGRM